ncbi:MAG: PDGLE domain-containing protein [Pseudomonadota bacterium]
MTHRYLLVGIALLALLIAGLVVHLASPAPDGLERVAEDLGFAGREQPAPDKVQVMPDYTVLGLESSWLGKSLAGLVGVLVTLVAGLALGAGLRRWQREASTGAARTEPPDDTPPPTVRGG